MKVLLVTPMPPDRRGAEAIPLLLHALVTGLAQRHTVTIATVAGPDPAEWSAVERLRAEGIEVHVARRVNPTGWARWRRRWRFASIWLRGRYPWRTVWFEDPGMQPLLDQLFREHTFDLIHLEDNAVGIYRLPRRVPAILTEHEVRQPRPGQWRGALRTYSPRALLREEDWRRWPRYQRAVWRRFDRIQVFTPRDALSARRIAPEIGERLRVVPFGIALPSLSVPAGEAPDSLLFTGTFTHYPNVDAALWLAREIMPRIRAQRPSARLTIVGAYPPADVQSLADDAIRVTGYVPDIEPYLQQAAVIVAPIRVGGGMRMKVLQALAAGKAVVTTSRGLDGLAWDGVAVPAVVADDADGFAVAVAELLADPARRHSLGQEARTFATTHFSPDAYARRVEGVYAELTKPASS